jgi:hypothetical protein
VLAVTIVASIFLAACRDDSSRDGEPSSQVSSSVQEAEQVPEYVHPPASFEQLLMQSAQTPLDASDGSTLTASSAGAAVSIPDRLSRGITLKEAEGTTGVRPVMGDPTGMTAANGVAVYRHAQPDTDIAVNILDPTAVRIFYVLTSRNAPRRFDITVDVPKDATLKLADGGVVMSRNGVPIGAASPPWAYDARGEVVPTRYELIRNTIVLSIDHRHSDTVYPVVADPPFFNGNLGKFIGGQLLSGIFQWAVVKAAGWAINKAKNNGCLTLSTFPSCTLHPFSYSWKNPAKPESSGPQAVTVPNVTGKRLPDAHDTLNAAGLTKIDYVDDTGQGRTVIQPGNWVVAAQEPEPGAKVPPATRISLRVRKPSDGTGPSSVTNATVPNVVCMNLQSAQDTLQSAGFKNLGSTDGLGQQRYQIIDRNWVVIKQSAQPGSRPSLETRINLTVVKYGESTGDSGCAS